jgi:hypothetical protein
MTPNSGPAGGGTVVAISGSDFTGATAVKFGSTNAVLFNVLNPTLIAVSSPAGSGTVDVTVTTPGGTSAASQFTYVVSQSTVSLASTLNPSLPGQIVTFTATVAVSSGQPTGRVTFKDAGVWLATVPLSAGAATYSTASLTSGIHMITAMYIDDDNSSGASATLVQAVNVPADSMKLKALQNQISPMVAQNSGAAITGAIGSAIGDAFDGGGTPVIAGPNGVTFNFTAEPGSEVTRRTDDAFTTLAYAARPDIVRKAPPLTPIREREWSLWADLRGTGWNSNNSNIDLKGSQLNLTAGVGYKLTPDLLVGAIVGYEHFKYDSASLGGGVKGSGGTFGSYAVWRFAPALRWDAALAWSSISYDAAAATATGTFTGHRWLAATGLTGSFRLASLVLEPSAKVYALWERQGEWTDSLGTLQSARNFAAGQVATGGKVIVPWQTSARTTVAPYVGLYGDWRYMTDDATPAGQPVVGMNAGWSGRVTGGVSVMKAGGGMVVVGGEYGGLGANFKMWTANGRVAWPF